MLSESNESSDEEDHETDEAKHKVNSQFKLYDKLCTR